MNRRRAAVLLGGWLALAFGAGASSQSDSAEVTLQEQATDDDAAWFVGEPLMTFKIYPGGNVNATAVEEYQDLLNHSDPVKAFTEGVKRAKAE